MQYMTNGFLPSTPHKVGLNTRERYAFAYFHEPNFSSVIQPLPEYGTVDKGIHYGKHFTNMFMRNYPERVTAKRMRSENRIAILDTPLGVPSKSIPLVSSLPPSEKFSHPNDPMMCAPSHGIGRTWEEMQNVSSGNEKHSRHY